MIGKTETLNQIRKKTLKLGGVIFVTVVVLLGMGCEKRQSTYLEFEQAARVVETMLKPANIRMTVFVSLYPEKNRRILLNFYSQLMLPLYSHRQN